MTAWDELTGQDDAIALLRDAAREGSEAMTHSWLITGPPGSGRSNLAYAFAAELLGGADDARTAAQVAARSHPDLAVLATDRVIISIDEVRHLVSQSQFSPSVAAYRVIVIEDADRMTERTSNVLLKALEEPPPRTVWILCAPNAADLIPTIRSRVRTVRLRVPTVADVAALLERRDGVPTPLAERAAREAQSHIGMAHRLATDQDARERRARSLEIALAVGSVSQAVLAAERLVALATDDAKALTIERDQLEREAALRSLGIEPGGTVPPALRAQIKALEEDQKRRATRSVRDGIDRVLVDLTSLYRDVLTLQLGAGVELVNEAIRERLEQTARASRPEQMLAALDAVATARRRIEGNMPPAMALEAMLITASGRVPALGSPA
ncbi:DNA polymerase-3 subunit delta' [Microcella putealis]|uniref:DNA polymerase-3 subunit delta n=1 Tax=Microcella putealis TaxID=337005 RepID=A0A4Q7LJ68_9MICO|nr:DNA polymerase III subunit delta' [Microcella putealis]RZS53479.1 DNA polymerase-3 subunit delta' [Microcella putealis]TQM26923.1 DNA polymerase-3 subunit delta' [Microcella putealis]